LKAKLALAKLKSGELLQFISSHFSLGFCSRHNQNIDDWRGCGRSILSVFRMWLLKIMAAVISQLLRRVGPGTSWGPWTHQWYCDGGHFCSASGISAVWRGWL